MPPAAHSSFIAFAEVNHAPRNAASGAPDFAACTVFSAVLVCAMRYTFNRSRGAVVVRETMPARPPCIVSVCASLMSTLSPSGTYRYEIA
jgi:hypothetical protein